jgi:transposase
MFGYISSEAQVPADHSLRPVRGMLDEMLKEMSSRFARVYARVRWPSIASERLLCPLLLRTSYSIRSERLLIH